MSKMHTKSSSNEHCKSANNKIQSQQSKQQRISYMNQCETCLPQEVPSHTSKTFSRNGSNNNNNNNWHPNYYTNPKRAHKSNNTNNNNNNINQNNSNGKTERQVTNDCDNNKTPVRNTYTKRTIENKCMKYINNRKVGTSENNVVQHHRYYSHSNGYNENVPSVYHTHYFSFSSPQYQHTGFFNRQRFYSEREERYNNSSNAIRNKRNHTLSQNSDTVVNHGNDLINTILGRFKSHTKFVEIKIAPPYLLTGSKWDKLNGQIWSMFMKHQQTEETYKKKIILWQYLYTFIRKLFPRYGLFMVGSTMSGFGSNTSDVDMCLLVRPTYVDQRSEALNYLEQIQYALKHCDFIDHVELICAKVPILKFHDSVRNLDIDLNCNNAVGIRNTHLLHCYANMDWRVRPLVLLVKLWANANHINAAKNMTISSYSLALMVIHFLQCGVTPPVVPCLHGLYPQKFQPDSNIHVITMQQEQLMPFQSHNNQSLGELLIGFLHYYATFNYSTYAMSVRLGARIPIDECRMARSYKNDPHQWKYLCIEEPFDLTNTARSVYDAQIFERIKSVFIDSYTILQETMDLNTIFQF